ncbi:ATP-binding cassette domain-containing protein [Rickettsiella endosymbiont of Aleochara curtula]|uniref:ATP-binding cassette domain-containing protein n=1 Tax=Rickettsiella endosymbiont of Aleochara curtula TaxID=3077936 RepID=UPI00313DCA56
MSDFVNIRGLYFSRNGRNVFSDIELNIPRGKITAIMGPSGCGKTTLLRLIGGQLKPERGNIQVDGKLINKLSRAQLYELRRKMGILFQSGALFTNLSVFENVAFPLREHTELPDFMIRDIVLMKLQSVGLRGAKNLMPNQLSGGMARRVALARAIALDPELIMYDEPFTGLDPIALGVIVKLISDLNKALGITTILVSHDVEEALSIADYIYVIASGKIIGHGTPEKVHIDKDPEVQQFLQGLPDGVVPFHYPAIDYNQDLLH